MPRQKKDARMFSVKLATPVYDKLSRFCNESGQNKTIAVERALSQYIDDYDQKQALLKEMESGERAAE